jgi:hypothetical protein
VREVLKACIRDGKTCTAIVNNPRVGLVLSVDRVTVSMFVKAILARRRHPKKKPKLTASAKCKRYHFGKQVVQQELGKRGCLGL